ncbi:MAG TPA: DUF4331 family protein [Polyangiaceae bacterium]|nr:DUF4331 family protein [Polyangiaceae bacterium]
MTPRALAASLAAAAAVAALLSVGRASDHLDGPRATSDPQADITDVFAFTSPENPSHVALAMTVVPFAGSSTAFSSNVDYVFRVRRAYATQPPAFDEEPLDVVCDFDGAPGGSPTQVKCTFPDGSTSMAAVGDTTGGGNSQSRARVFAGLRSDPAFVDRQGMLATVAAGRASFTGQNTFARANVLALVIDVDVSVFGPGKDDAGRSEPLLAVAAETLRRKN